uniref:Uncharacterized protein LOC111103107 isoform X1 n=2 Tax=Crassostrea virginica TaxID=6565 RepID=A0A8B8ANY3_CRAVI|nr:uncharacterized protein LOC111103107 isoform X1 [Crassostrea virginica]
MGTRETHRNTTETKTMPQRLIQRRPTMPMGKGEREVLSERRLQEPLVQSRTDLAESDGHEMATLRRSDSYKEATSKDNRISVIFGINSDFHKIDYDREKYKTLPSQMGTVRLTSRTTSGQRRRSTASPMVDRQESGIVPSPDTDDDQKSTGSARKKKSRLQKVKERILHSFQRQRITDEEKRQKRRQKLEHQKKVKIRKKKMKSPSLEAIQEQVSPEAAPPSRLKRIFSLRRTRRIYNGDANQLKDSTPKGEKGGPMVNGKSAGARGAPARGSQVTPLDSMDGPSNAVDTVFKTILLDELSREHSSDKKVNTPSARGKKPNRGDLSLDLSSPNRRRKVFRRFSSKEEVKETVSHGSFRFQRKFLRQLSTYSDIEVDGGDECDHPVSDKHHKDTRPFDNLSADEKEHRIAEVASRLKFIGDKAVERYNTESSSSAVESPQGQGHSGRADDRLVQQLVEAFRQEGDRFSQEYKLGSLTPVVLDIARQHTYSQFKSVVHASLQSSIGWDQIALYFHLTRTAVHVAKGSVSVAQMAYQYFRETYSGWVEERGGWETMLEETDCELD